MQGVMGLFTVNLKRNPEIDLKEECYLKNSLNGMLKTQIASPNRLNLQLGHKKLTSRNLLNKKWVVR
jgi:hypothetical protein